MSDLQKYIKRQMEDPKFRAEFDAASTEYEIMHALIAARIEEGLTQKELAERSGIRQSNISRIENGSCSPTIATLEALAKGLGRTLAVKFTV